MLSREEEKRLLDACVGHVRDVVTLILDTGLRKSNALGLTWAQVKFSDSEVRIKIEASLAKARKPIVRLLPERSAAMLRRLYQDRPGGATRVFMYQGKPVYNIRTGFDAACIRAGMEDFHVHDLRHAFASKLMNRGAGLLLTSKLLGHATTRMTERYAHIDKDTLDSANQFLTD